MKSISLSYHRRSVYKSNVHRWELDCCAFAGWVTGVPVNIRDLETRIWLSGKSAQDVGVFAMSLAGLRMVRQGLGFMCLAAFRPYRSYN